MRTAAISTASYTRSISRKPQRAATADGAAIVPQGAPGHPHLERRPHGRGLLDDIAGLAGPAAGRVGTSATIVPLFVPHGTRMGHVRFIVTRIRETNDERLERNDACAR